MDAEINEGLARIHAATERLLATTAPLTSRQVREPSLLPGWTRGHVLTHIARSADGLGNLLRWARTGAETPMYASSQARNADIEAGAGRPAADLAADVRESAAAFAARAAELPSEAWQVPVRRLRGPAAPAARVLAWRLAEVEIHHVDLAAGYRPSDWPAAFVAGCLPDVAGSFAGRDDVPPCRISVPGSAAEFRLGPRQQPGPVVTVTGPAADLLAWLTGRDSGAGLRVLGDPAVLPVLPSW